uniref:Clu domain-containing protein n=1 Tax=Macrostomum lignano TaxID=282301 RepID=A0A1I8F543_9PLAT
LATFCPFVDADERDNNLYVPAEFGFVKFSLARGVVGLRGTALATAGDPLTDTHGIPTQQRPEAEESMARLCIELKALCLIVPRLNSNISCRYLIGCCDQQITQLLDRHRYTGEEHACKRHRQEDNT